jgi:hypothetical protein
VFDPADGDPDAVLLPGRQHLLTTVGGRGLRLNSGRQQNRCRRTDRRRGQQEHTD